MSGGGPVLGSRFRQRFSQDVLLSDTLQDLYSTLHAITTSLSSIFASRPNRFTLKGYLSLAGRNVWQKLAGAWT
ncbi:hypothetical protein I312_106371 [Cryptococcus bacillisporus CA1280]|uniref:uncharacterized protein n=1 Tax=Cryptococcus bacillisporus CA1280 TaxID=1296109 RepID=UPI003369A2C8